MKSIWRATAQGSNTVERNRRAGDATQLQEAMTVLASLWDEDAEVWESRWAPLFREFAEEVVRRADLKPAMWVLDVGTGTGSALLLAAAKVAPDGKAVGIDRSHAMLERARRNVARAGSSSRVLEMDAGALEFPDNWFHAVISNDGIPYLGMRNSLAEVRRVLRPGGRFVFSDWATDKVAAMRIFQDVFEQHKTKNPSARLRRLREGLAVWAEAAEGFGEREAFEEALQQAGFSQVKGETISHTISRFTLEDFLQARLSRAVVRFEYEEMTPMAREEFDRAVRERLAHLVQDGRFEVLWPVFYLQAVK
jgi:ubiquinone/menaquinone biosynthesis C-methylase UbiE